MFSWRPLFPYVIQQFDIHLLTSIDYPLRTIPQALYYETGAAANMAVSKVDGMLIAGKQVQ